MAAEHREMTELETCLHVDIEGKYMHNKVFPTKYPGSPPASHRINRCTCRHDDMLGIWSHHEVVYFRGCIIRHLCPCVGQCFSMLASKGVAEMAGKVPDIQSGEMPSLEGKYGRGSPEGASFHWRKKSYHCFLRSWPGKEDLVSLHLFKVAGEEIVESVRSAGFTSVGWLPR